MSTNDSAGSAQLAMNEYWTRRSGPYDDYQQRDERRDLDREAWSAVYADALGAAPLDVLDVGTGSGYVAYTLAGLGHRVTGTDLSEGMLERARAHAAGTDGAPEFLVGDAVAPAFDDGSFDAVVNRYLVWTLREPERALAQWKRVLRPGGQLVVVDATWFSQGLHVGATPEFAQAYDEQVREALPLAEATSVQPLVQRIEAAGFVDVSVVALTRLHELDLAHGVAPGHEVVMQHLVRATRP